MNLCKHLMNRVIEKMVHPGKKAVSQIELGERDIDGNNDSVDKRNSIAGKINKNESQNSINPTPKRSIKKE